MNTKKWLLVGAAVVLLIALTLGILALAGVFGPYMVGLCLPQKDSRWNGYYDLLEDKLLQAQYQVERCSVNDDPAVQLQQVQQLLQKGCRRFVIQPVDAGQTEAMLQLLQEKGAKVVFINTRPENLEQYPDFSYVGFDPEQAGRLQAQLVLKIAHRADHNSDAALSYAVLDSQNTAAWWESCAAALQEENPVCLEVQHCADADSAQAQCAGLLSRYGKDLEVIFCGDDLLLDGILEAIADGGRQAGEDILLVGAHMTDPSLALVEQGKLTGTLAVDTQLAASWVLQLLESRDQSLDLAAYHSVDSENLDDYLQWLRQYGA